MTCKECPITTQGCVARAPMRRGCTRSHFGAARLRDMKLCSDVISPIRISAQSCLRTNEKCAAPAASRFEMDVVVEGSSMGRISGSGSPGMTCSRVSNRVSASVRDHVPGLEGTSRAGHPHKAMPCVLPRIVLIRIMFDTNMKLSAIRTTHRGLLTRISRTKYTLHQCTLGRELLGWKDAFAVVSNHIRNLP